ncbi:MAG: hypothetical protein E6Q92_08395 [Burkholderiaceae bacterium]|nr:MAG: hypothetical protein E6Q92_08395 [Burkholderiaceae bacterium]
MSAAMWGRGSLPWLMYWEMKLAWAQARNKSANRKFTLGLSIAFLLLMHAFGALMAYKLPDKALPAMVHVMLGVGVLVVTAMSLLVSFQQVGELVLGQRRDGLLRHSPVPTSRWMLAQAIGLSANSISLLLIMVMPIVNMAVLFGHVRFASSYFAILGATFVATTAGLALVRGLVALLGPTRARSAAQWVGLALSRGWMLYYFSGNRAGDKTAWKLKTAEALTGGEQVLAWLGSSLSGNWLAAGALFGAGLAALALAVRWLSVIYERQESGVVRRQAATEEKAWKGTTWWAALARKEWLRIQRDPKLVGSVLTPVLMCIVLSVSSFKMPGGLSFMVVVMFCAGIHQLCDYSIRSDEALPVLHTAPLPVSTQHMLAMQQAVVAWPMVLVASGCVLLQLAKVSPLEVLLTLLSMWLAIWVTLHRQRVHARPGDDRGKAFNMNKMPHWTVFVVQMFTGLGGYAGHGGWAWLCLLAWVPALLVEWQTWLDREDRESLYD